MDFDSANSSLVDYRNNSEKAAEIFAQKVHDDWEVGHQTESCGGTGILLFLSIDDRAVYVSRGAALRNVLSDRRLDQTIESIRPDLIQYQYGKAIMLALQDLDNNLIMGEPDWKERTLHVLEDYSTYLIFLIFFGVVGIAASHEEKKRREYAKVASHLNELDQARAEALQGRFQAKSCPICLENFQSVTKDEASTEVTEDETEALTLKGSDGLPLRLLRCGHVFDEACWEDWISSGHHGKVGKCPVCQQDIGQSSNISVDATRTVLPADASTRLDETSEFRRSGDEDIEIRNRVFRQYTHDRNFRLLRLASRYPQYIRPQQIQSWTQVGYDGSLARDPSFMGRDPTRLSASSSSSGSSASGNGGGRGSIGGSGFGGGCSGGGRGGRW